MSTAEQTATARAYELDRAHVFHSWSAQAELQPMVITGGQGCRAWNDDGAQFLDFSSQLINLNIGHQHPRVVEAIVAQAQTLATIAPATANLARGEAAERIVAHAPENFRKVFFTNGGADANENAIRMARIYTGRDKVLSTYRSYHGNTGAAVVATGDWRRVPNEYARGHVHFFGPYLYRSEFFAQTPEQECERALAHLDRVIRSEGAESVAAILLETVPGTAGILVPPPGYLAGVREIAHRHGIVLIFDEVMAGFGRTGSWFAFDQFEATPDLITFAKGVNSGYVPVGGVLVSDDIAATFAHRVFPGGLTYSGHPLAAASIVATIDAMADEGIVDNAARVGRDVIGPQLQTLAEDFDIIGEVRGLGVFWAIELVADQASHAPASANTMNAVKSALTQRGLLAVYAENRIHFVPPCIVTDDEVHEAVTILRDALSSLT